MRVILKLLTLALACDRTEISDRPASTMVNTIFQDVGIVLVACKEKAIDRTEVRREREKKRIDLQ